jgi:hypothetical protein
MHLSSLNITAQVTEATVELNPVSDVHIPLQQQVQVPMQMQVPMQVPPQHFQDSHATAGVPGYPYPHPQQFYTAMYMNQV